MKHCKYIIFAILVLLISTTKTYADLMCYYMSDGYRVQFNASTNEAEINLIGNSAQSNSEAMSNYCDDWGLAQRGNKTEAGHVFEDYLDSWCISGKQIDKCPEYLVFQYCSAYRIWGTESESEAQEAVNDINNNTECMAKFGTFKNSDESPITEEQYYNAFVTPEVKGEDYFGKNDDIDTQCNKLFGNVDDDGEKNEETGEYEKYPSLAYYVNQVMLYIRIIVPILIILLGSIDLAKAVVASKEDQIKKAQSDFAKRVVMGVVIFFVPVLVNIIMKLADIVWEGLGYGSCTLPK